MKCSVCDKEIKDGLMICIKGKVICKSCGEEIKTYLDRPYNIPIPSPSPYIEPLKPDNPYKPIWYGDVRCEQ